MLIKNINDCRRIVKKYYVSKNLLGSARVELICAICTCAEQTFSQAKAHGKDFARAFEVAMEAYMDGVLKGKVAIEIQAKVNLQNEGRLEDAGVALLVDIMKAHRLRL